jgi:acetyl esterase/lipase
VPTTHRDIVFAEHPGFRPLALDAHLPDAASAPVVIFLHGGGWRQGSRRTFWPGMSDAAAFGRIVAAEWAVVSVDYRLSGEAVFPAQLDDVRAALDWVRTEGVRRFGLDAARIVLWGESAGAHLAALVGLTDDGVRGVVDWYGPSDLRTLPQNVDEVTREESLLGGKVADLPDRALAASPVAHVHEGAPPFLIAHGDADRFVPVGQSTALAEALRGVGAEATLQTVPDVDHIWRGLDDPDTVFDPALEFLRGVA